ncbi:PREDICTED: uncharacterized protein LOC101312495 [Fragaria vesca subsp. vesca]
MQSPSLPTPDKNDWRESIKNEMSQLHKGGRLKMLKDYSMMFEELYRRLSGGILARCIDEGEAQRRLKEIHGTICGVEHVVSLYRRLERKGYYWSSMKQQVAEMQSSCHKCSILMPSEHEGITATMTKDRRSPYLEYLICKTLPEDRKHAYKIKKIAKRYFVDGTYYTENGSMQQNLSLSGLRQFRFKATGEAISNFIREYIFCRFGIPYKIVTDNGTPFVNQKVSITLKGYEIKHKRSTPYYPQGNGQAEATNKTLIRMLSKMVHEYKGGWSTHLPDVLWAYRTSPRSATGFSPYSLVYGSEAVLLVEIMILLARVLAVNDLEWDAESCAKWRTMDLEATDERKRQAEVKAEAYRQTMTKAYNRTIKERSFKE